MFQSFKKMKSADFVYMTILLVFFCVVTVGFFLTTRFIEKNINEIFSNDVTDDTQALNLDNYHFVEKKLSLPVSNLNTTEAEPLSVTTDSPHLDKGMIVISIVNSTNEEGAASSLAQVFTEAGFKTPKIGNSVGFSATTTISMKESKKNYGPVILAEVTKKYPAAVLSEIFEKENANYDIAIIIGKN